MQGDETMKRHTIPMWANTLSTSICDKVRLPFLCVGLSAILVLGAAAHADPINDCYTTAEAANAGLSVAVGVSGAAVVKSSDLAIVMDAVAEHHEAASLTLSYNTAGRRALRRAMHCIFSNGHATLSAIVLNQNVDDLRVRPITVRRIAATDGSEMVMNFAGVDATCAAEHALRFEGEGESTYLPVQVRGRNDLHGSLSAVMTICSPGPMSPCSGTCLGQCTDDKPFADCYCDGGTGSCSAGIAQFDVGGAGEIATVLQ
jgi:hypothetical protein